MKKILIVFFFSAAFATVNAQTAAPVTQVVHVPESLLLKESNFDFGKIPQGRPVTHNFEITNTGKEALKLESVQAACGCTTPEWNKEPIAPGATTTIKVGYNAMADGYFSKPVTITYNGNQTKTLNITGTVFRTPTTSAPLNTSISLLKQTNQ